MTPEELRRAQRVSNDAFTSLATPLVRSAVGRPGAIASLARILLPQVIKYRSVSFLLARQFYQSQRTDVVGFATRTGPLRAAAYPARALTDSLHRTLPDADDPLGTVGNAQLNQAVADVIRQVEDAGRRGTLDMIVQDPKSSRWQRYDPEKPCAFCALLISRGAVYLSEETAIFSAHPHCNCLAVPVFTGQKSWEGKEQGEKFDALYVTATGGLKPGEDKLAAFRRHFEQQGT